MQGLPDGLVTAVGRVTIAAGDLELALALAAAHQGEGEGNTFEIMAKPGEPLRSAQRAVPTFPSPYREAMALAVDEASAVPCERHAVVHAMWINDRFDQEPESWELLHFKTYVRRPASAELLEKLAARMMEKRNQAVRILTAYINKKPVTWTP